MAEQVYILEYNSEHLYRIDDLNMKLNNENLKIKTSMLLPEIQHPNGSVFFQILFILESNE